MLARWSIRKWFPRRRQLHSVRFLFLSSLTIPLFVATSLTSHRSTHVADDIVFAKGGLLVQATSVNGYLMLELACHWPEQTPLCHTSIVPDTEWGDDHDFRSSHQTILRGPASLFGYSRPTPLCSYYGNDSFPMRNTYFEYAYAIYYDDTQPLYSLPRRFSKTSSPSIVAAGKYAVLLPLLLLPLALHLAAPIPANLRRRARLRRGLCPNCSYDLRATHTPNAGLLPTCPECGQQIPHQNHHI